MRVPSKTFLVGEYAALCGGEALILATAPYFEIQQGGAWVPHPESPAAGLWPEGFGFVDPHGGRGGFGASGAQMLLAMAQNQSLQVLGSNAARIVQKDYASKFAGSGYDLAAQILGGVARVCSQTETYESHPWKFQELDFLIYRSGYKVPTHELVKGAASEQLRTLVGLSQETVRAYLDGDMAGFFDGLGAFVQEQSFLGLVDERILELVEKAESDPDVLFAKGCGAMAADTLLMVVEAGKTEIVKNRWSGKLEFVAQSRDLALPHFQSSEVSVDR